jgi:hypothetical protein
MKKCSKKSFCKAVTELVEFDVKKKTLVINQYFNIKTSALTHKMIFRYSKGAILVNYCPWCGGSIKDGVEVR